MRAWFDIDVAEDGSGTFELTMAFDEEFQALMEEDAEGDIDWTDPESWDDAEGTGFPIDELPEDAEVRPYTEDGFEGFTVSFPFDSLDEFDALIEEMSDDGSEDPFPFHLTSTDGRFELSTDGEVFGPADDEFSGEDMEMIPEEMLSDLFDFRVRASLPGELVSHNADEVTEEGMLVWRLDPLAEEQVSPQAVSEVSQGSWLVWVLGGVALLAAAVLAVVAIRRMNAPDPDPPVA